MTKKTKQNWLKVKLRVKLGCLNLDESFLLCQRAVGVYLVILTLTATDEKRQNRDWVRNTSFLSVNQEIDSWVYNLRIVV